MSVSIALQLVAVAALLCLVAWAAAPREVNQDVAWSIVVARHVHAGAQLYRDVLDINPPLIYWFAGGAIAVGKAFSVSDVTAYYVATIATCALSAVASGLALRGTRAFFAVVLAGYLPIMVAGPSFGQREQLIAALCLPMIFVLGRRIGGEWPSPAVQVVNYLLASIAFCLKPYFAAVWLVGLAVLWLKRRSLAAADGVPVAVGSAYLLAIALFTPDYARMLADYASMYSRWRHESLVLLLLQPGSLVGLAALLSGMLAHRKLAKGPEAVWLGFASFLAALAAILQFKAFGYHWFPALIFALATAAVIARDMRRRSHPAVVGGVVASCLALAALAANWRNELEYRRALRPLSNWVKAQRPGTSVLVLSRSSIGVVGPVLGAGLTWANAWQVVWWPDVFLDDGQEGPDEDKQFHESERLALVGATRALTSGSVDIVAVDLPRPDTNSPPSAPFDMDAYIRRLPGVVEELTSCFSPGRREGPFIVYHRHDGRGVPCG